MSTKHIAILALLGLGTACQASPPEMTEAQRVEVENAVAAAATAQQDDWLAQTDMEQYLSHQSDWGGGAWGNVNSLDDLRQLVGNSWERWDYERISPLEWDVRVLGPDVAAARASFRLRRTDGETVVEFDVDQAQVWVVEDAEWKLLVAKEKWLRR